MLRQRNAFLKFVKTSNCLLCKHIIWQMFTIRSVWSLHCFYLMQYSITNLLKIVSLSNSDCFWQKMFNTFLGWLGMNDSIVINLLFCIIYYFLSTKKSKKINFWSFNLHGAHLLILAQMGSQSSLWCALKIIFFEIKILTINRLFLIKTIKCVWCMNHTLNLILFKNK